MSLLADWQIRQLCLDMPENEMPMIEPYSRAVSGGGIVSYGETSAGYDLRLGRQIIILKSTYGEVVDPRFLMTPGIEQRIYDSLNRDMGDPFILPAHSYILGHSLEYLRIPRTIKGRCVGKSTLARLGILINTTPLEPGWCGHLTIEIGNVSPSPVRLRIGEGIAQLEFDLLAATPQVSYADKGGKYQGQTGVTTAKVI